MLKYIFSVLLIFLVIGCEDIPRDNLLDPKNEDGYTESVVLIEAFVNLSAEILVDYNLWAVDGLDQVQTRFGEQVIIVEYHRNVSGYIDPFTDTTKYVFKELHEEYTANELIPMGVPDIFINGLSARVSGASSIENVASQVISEVLDPVDQKNYFRIEPDVVVGLNNSLQVNCLIAALGNQTFSDLKVRLIFLKSYSGPPHTDRVAIDMIKSDFLPHIGKGEIIEKSFSPVTFSEPPDKIVIAVLSADGKYVLQSVVKELP